MSDATTLPTTVAAAKAYAQAALDNSFLHRDTSFSNIVWSIFVLLALYLTTTAVYNIWFHPLRNFPGPLLARSTLLWRVIHSLGGRFHVAIQEQHKKHGPVFRVSPNELSFGSAASFKAIYGHPTAGKPTFTKSEFYDVFGAGFNSRCIGSEREPRRHGQMKRNLTAAFSSKALAEQEEIVGRCLDGFVDKLNVAGDGGKKPLNATKWFEMISFDILGEMAFGESFGCIESGKPHFWQELILEHLFFITVVDNLRRYPLVPTLARLIFPFTTSIRDKHSGYVRGQVARRLDGAKPADFTTAPSNVTADMDVSSRKDFLTNIASKVTSGQVEREELTAHASTLVIAGGETVSTFLAACTYYLLQTPGAYEKLRDEIRGAFEGYSEIDAAKAGRLPYLAAVVAEGLRIYPPGSQGFQRLSPGAEVDGYYIPKGTEVYTSAWTVVRDPANFREPSRFAPERWLTTTNTTPDGEEITVPREPEFAADVREASQPFSLGPRGCLGRNFAMMEINLIMAKMHYRYDLELADRELDWEGSSHCHVMWWKPDLHVRFQERDGFVA